MQLPEFLLCSYENGVSKFGMHFFNYLARVVEIFAEFEANFFHPKLLQFALDSNMKAGPQSASL